MKSWRSVPRTFALLLITSGAWAATFEPVTPDAGFNGERYKILWTKSPFAIATPDAPAIMSDYQLVGIAQFDGISYATLIEKQTQVHFVLTSGKPLKDLTLVSITPGKNGVETTALIHRNGEPLILTLEQAPASAAPGNMPLPSPNMPVPSQAPNVNSAVGGIMYPSPLGLPPRARFHRNLIHVPPPPPPPH